MIWRPFTQEKTAAPAMGAISAKGAYIFSESGEKYIDMVSSWWVNLHGHANGEIAEAMGNQAKTLEHVIFAEFSHAPAELLVENLKTVLPKPLARFFFSDNGSTAVEIALKMAYQYFKNIGVKGRSSFLHLEGGYHGDTFGAMSVAGRNSKYHSTFSELFFDTIPIPVPEYYEGVEQILEREEQIIGELDENLRKIGDGVCALIVEPLVQGAAGMRLYRPEFLNKLVETVRRRGILVIFDEVMTGFYRTGKMFAMEYGAHVPDFLCLAKGITGGFMPLAMTVTTDKIYDAFLSDGKGKAFAHGHSYTANPIACAAANKSFEILSRAETLNNINTISACHGQASIGNVSKIRTLGTILAFDLASEDLAQSLAETLLHGGIFLRPLGKTIYLLPPYCVVKKELHMVYEAISNHLGN
jgi:adenosylmethionine-8-amino-7-oxononanoate aminotransferase